MATSDGSRTMGSIQLRQTGGIARITLDRPQVHNAFDDALIA